MKYELVNGILSEEIIYMRKLVGWGKEVTKEQFKKALYNTMCKGVLKMMKI